MVNDKTVVLNAGLVNYDGNVDYHQIAYDAGVDYADLDKPLLAI